MAHDHLQSPYSVSNAQALESWHALHETVIGRRPRTVTSACEARSLAAIASVLSSQALAPPADRDTGGTLSRQRPDSRPNLASAAADAQGEQTDQ